MVPDVYKRQDVDKALSTAESIAGSMKDEYVSVEHLFLALLDTANSSLKDLYRTYNITREGVLKALTAVRGNQRVTSVSYTHLDQSTRKGGGGSAQTSAPSCIMLCMKMRKGYESCA